jgi:cytochrome c553
LSTWQHERAKIGAITRGIRAGERPADDPELDEAYRNLHALRLEEAVLKALATAPRPSDDQLQSIAALLLAGRPAAAAQPVKKQKRRGRPRRDETPEPIDRAV